MNIKIPMILPTLNIEDKNYLSASFFLNTPKLNIFLCIVERLFVKGHNVPHRGTMCPTGVQYILMGYNVTLGGTESKSAGYNMPFSRYVVLLF